MRQRNFSLYFYRCFLVAACFLWLEETAWANDWNVRITSRPPKASVLLNGVAQGTTPLQLQVKTGRYHVEVRRRGYLTWTSYLEVPYRATISIQISLESAQSPSTSDNPSSPSTTPPSWQSSPGRNLSDRQGLLIIQSTPQGCSIYVRGQLLGITPLLTQLSLGKHEITLQKRGYLPLVRTVHIQEHRSFQLQVVLLKDPAAERSSPIPLKTVQFLLISSPTARVFLNGRFIGSTPFISEGLPVGTYQLLLVQKGYYPYRRTIRLETEKRLKLHIHLVPRQSRTFPPQKKKTPSPSNDSMQHH